VIHRIKALAVRARRRQLAYVVPSGAAVLVLFMVLLPAHGWAAAYGAVSGIVRDDGDRPVAGARVVLESATHAITERQTDSLAASTFQTCRSACTCSSSRSATSPR